MEYRDSASYCQGMNYVMGFFLLSFQNEEFAYRCFAQLLEKVQMPIFTDNFAHLQSNFYVLDRMLSVYIPDLWEHLKVPSAYLRKKGSCQSSMLLDGSSLCSPTRCNTQTLPISLIGSWISPSLTA
jgi:hypothetical protein